MKTLSLQKRRKEIPFLKNKFFFNVFVAFVVWFILFSLYDCRHAFRKNDKNDKNDNVTQKQRESPWKLWHDMSPDDQDSALELAMQRAKRYGNMQGRAETYHKSCPDGKKPVLFGSRGGGHMVCGPKPKINEECSFMSFGIRDYPSFDRDLAETWENCRGFSGNPSSTHPSRFSPNVSFHNIGLTMTVGDRPNPNDKWILSSLPKLREFLGWDYLSLVKLDCEGCEVAMVRDILQEDPFFLDRVGQISIETHVAKKWVETREELYYYAVMFSLLQDAGFELVWSKVIGCGNLENGCMEEMEGRMGMACGNKPRNPVNDAVIGRSCHDWLWVKD